MIFFGLCLQRDVDSDLASCCGRSELDEDGHVLERQIALPGITGGGASLPQVADPHHSHLRPNTERYSHLHRNSSRCSCGCHRVDEEHTTHSTAAYPHECGQACDTCGGPPLPEHSPDRYRQQLCRRCRRFGGRGCRRHRYHGRHHTHSISCRCPLCTMNFDPPPPWVIPLPPGPAGPPPLYYPTCLPPYIEDDIVPDYRSTISSPEPAPDYRSTTSSLMDYTSLMGLSAGSVMDHGDSDPENPTPQ